jgi:hypothetical protein
MSSSTTKTLLLLNWRLGERTVSVILDIIIITGFSYCSFEEGPEKEGPEVLAPSLKCRRKGSRGHLRFFPLPTAVLPNELEEPSIAESDPVVLLSPPE